MRPIVESTKKALRFGKFDEINKKHPHIVPNCYKFANCFDPRCGI